MPQVIWGGGVRWAQVFFQLKFPARGNNQFSRSSIRRDCRQTPPGIMGPDEFLAGEEEEILPSPSLLLRKGLGAEFSVKN